MKLHLIIVNAIRNSCINNLTNSKEWYAARACAMLLSVFHAYVMSLSQAVGSEARLIHPQIIKSESISLYVAVSINWLKGPTTMSKFLSLIYVKMECDNYISHKFW